MRLNLMKKTAIYSMLFSAAALGVIFYAASNQVIAAPEVVQDELWLDNVAGNAQATGLDDVSGQSGDRWSLDGAGHQLTFSTGSSQTSYLCIPLPQGTVADKVTIENHYMDEEMWVVVDETADEFYETAVISGNRSFVEQGIYETDGGQAILKFSLTDIFEYRSILEEDQLYVEFVPPREMYERIIVIDPAFGGSETGHEGNGMAEKDIVLAIAARVKERLDAEDIKVYYTRMDDNDLSEDRRVRIANNTKADLLIRIEADAADDSLVHGTTAVYNEDFFIPGFGSIELADALERSVVSNIRGKAVGLVAAGEGDYVIRQATVPAAAIRVGYLTNTQEAILLQKEDYLDKIAEGIYQAIMEVYGEDEE
ncbi:MAG: N-acetylmuramoyl-L-alanine amidase [Lachnospiraceae bacterium]|nr:N-acetylmuramoyl-L-alanine amidase [Lachnospiraceae bacterium]